MHCIIAWFYFAINFLLVMAQLIPVTHLYPKLKYRGIRDGSSQLPGILLVKIDQDYGKNDTKTVERKQFVYGSILVKVELNLISVWCFVKLSSSTECHINSLMVIVILYYSISLCFNKNTFSIHLNYRQTTSAIFDMFTFSQNSKVTRKHCLRFGKSRSIKATVGTFNWPWTVQAKQLVVG